MHYQELIESPSETKSKAVRKPCRPFLKWAGGKANLLKSLQPRIPATYGKYFEPFVGGGALFFATRPTQAVLSDVNGELMNLYRVIKDQVEALIEDLGKHRYEKEYFYSVRNIDRDPEYQNWSDVERASRLIYLNKTCFNGLFRVNSKGYFNTPFGRYVNPKILDADNLRACALALSHAEIRTGEFECIEQSLEPDDFIYLDPPYVPISPTANFTGYSKEGFDLTMQTRLLEFCRRLNAKKIRFMLSNSSAPWVVESYREFSIEFVSVPRAINSKADGRSNVQEILVTNYETGVRRI